MDTAINKEAIDIDTAITYFHTINDFTNLPPKVNFEIIKVCRAVLNCLGMLTSYIMQNVPYVSWDQGIELEINEKKYIWRVLRLHALQVAYTNWVNNADNKQFHHSIFSYVKNQQKLINIYYNLKSIHVHTLQSTIEKSVIFLDSWQLNDDLNLLKKCQKLIFSKDINNIITKYYSKYIPNISPKSSIIIDEEIWKKTDIYALLHIYIIWFNTMASEKPFNLIFDKVDLNTIIESESMDDIYF
tara:strand:- start:897 stop:1625 length:729 start_codon:yes stop_codon:yes gene_type:complete